jgi:phage regulator Rha-like protein
MKRSSVADSKAIVPIERIERMIVVIRGQKVMIDSDLAELYGVETRILNRAVSRNKDRFPEDFMFRLSRDEWLNLKSQFGTSSSWGGRRKPPYAFTEHGAVMLANVLRSETAISVSIQVVRAFIRLRRLLRTNEELSKRLDELEKKYDAQFKVVFDAIRELMTPPEKEQRRIGFRNKE